MLVSRWSLFLFIGLSADVLARRGKRTSEPDGKSSTQDSVDEYLRGVCAERGTWSTLTRPCEILLTIDYQCLTGLDFDVDVDVMNQPSPDCGNHCQSFDFQRTCYCQSQYLDSAMGCYACYFEHGGAASTLLTKFDWQGLPAIVDGYCDPMQNPTAALGVYQEPLFTSVEDLHVSSTKFSDPLGFSKTDVSLYFMQRSMTGVEAWSTTLSTIENWSKDGIETFLSEEQAHVVAPASEDDSRGSTSSNNVTPLASASGTPIKDSNPSDSTSTTFSYPPIIIQPAYPTSTTKPLPPASLVTKDGASNIARVGSGGVFAILGLVAVATML